MSTQPTGPVFMETPASAIRGVQRETVIIDGRTFLLERPSQSDKLLDDPAIVAANERDDYMPYWADIWPAARMLAKAILRGGLPADDGGEALDLGCGLGLPGIAALATGRRVLFADYDLAALRFADRNARLNGFSRFRTLPLDWRFPPDDLHVSLVLAADLIYEKRNVDALISFLRRVLRPQGVCLLTDPNRTQGEYFREQLSTAGMSFTTEFARAGEPGGIRVSGTLYRITVRA